jgi:Anti-sigma-K factor rskA
MIPAEHDGANRQVANISELTDSELDDLLGAYALNAVDNAEQDAVNRYLARSPRARSEVADHLLVASALGSSAAEAPLPLWDRISDQLVEKQPATASTGPTSPTTSKAQSPTRNATVIPIERRTRSTTRAMAWVGSAAAAIIAIGFLGFQVEHQNQRIGKINKELQAAQAKNQNTLSVETLMAAPGTKVATLEADGRQLARIVLGKDGRGFLVNSASFHLPKGEVLQLWGVQNDQVISLGVMSDSTASVPLSAAGDWSKFVLTAEHTGGVVVSDGPALAAGTFTA